MMVQRKVPSKKHGILPIQADHPGDHKMKMMKKKKKKQTSGHQDGKIVKRSGSVNKCSDFQKIPEIQRRPMSRPPGKPPSLVGSSPATPQKPSRNFMKSTASSNARREKERLPSSKSLNLDKKICSNSKTASATFSYSGSGNHKSSPARNTTKSSTSKKKTTVRTLMKAPSFKKYSKTGLCGEVKNVRRSTCSSTMKDSKFPPYLVIGDEGTSVLKVCTYTYCSLNGHHHHQPLLPLNCFLEAKRQSLKAQRSVELGSLSPGKATVPGASEIVGAFHKSQNETDFCAETSSADKEGKMIDSSHKDCKPVEEQSLFDGISDSAGVGSCGEEEGKMERSFAGGIASMLEVEEDEDHKNSEATEMEWEQSHDSASQVDDVVGGNFCNKGDLLFMEYKKSEIVELLLDDISSCRTEEFLADELMIWELFGEETEAATSSSVTSQDGDSEKDIDEQDDALEDDDDSDTDSMAKPIQKDFLGGPENDAALKPQEDEKDCRTGTVAQSLNDQLQLPNVEPEKCGNNGLLGVWDSSTGCSEGDQDCKEYSETKQLRSIGNGVEEWFDEDRDKSNEGTCASNVGMSGWARKNSKQELEDPCSNWKWNIGCRRTMYETKENERDFNPVDPNFLPLVPDPDAERIDLKHQTLMDERKNSQEWMIDHALQQAVTKLASAARRKRKVALLVEAFETVSPIPKYEPPRMRHSSPVFSPTTPRPIQACS